MMMAEDVDVIMSQHPPRGNMPLHRSMRERSVKAEAVRTLVKMSATLFLPDTKTKTRMRSVACWRSHAIFTAKCRLRPVTMWFLTMATQA